MKLALTKLLFETGRKGLFLIVSLFFTIWTSSAHGQAGLTAQTDPKNLYDQMIQSRKNYNYSGIFTYEQGGQLQSYSVESSLLDGFIEKKMEPLNGPENTHQMSFESACEQTQNPNSEQLSSYYNFYTRSETRIAGINGIEIVLAPVDKYRHGYQYVIDPLTGLMLRSVILTPDRRMIERLQYVQLDYQPSYESSNYASLEAFSNAFEDASEQADLVDDASLPVQKRLLLKLLKIRTKLSRKPSIKLSQQRNKEFYVTCLVLITVGRLVGFQMAFQL